jgi:hypothetical protein
MNDQIIFVPAGKSGVGVQVRTVLLTLQASVVVSMVPPSVRNCTEVLAVSIGSLKVKTTTAEGETTLARFAGTVETIVGWAEAICGTKMRNAATLTDALVMRLHAACKYRFITYCPIVDGPPREMRVMAFEIVMVSWERLGWTFALRAMVPPLETAVTP